MQVTFSEQHAFPVSGSKNKPSKKLSVKQVASSCLLYSSTMNMEAKYISKMLVDFQQTTRRYVLEDTTLHTRNKLRKLYELQFLKPST
jgi:hypothetical protein